MVAIVPGLQQFQRLFRMGIRCYFRYFISRKAHDIGISIIKNGADMQIVETAEYAFLGNPQDPGQDGEIQEFIAFLGVIEKGAEIRDCRIVEIMIIGILDRNIVFIDEDDGPDLIIAI